MTMKKEKNAYLNRKIEFTGKKGVAKRVAKEEPKEDLLKGMRPFVSQRPPTGLRNHGNTWYVLSLDD